MPIPDTPYTRKEAYLNAAATGDTSGIPETPYTREEMYLDAIAKGGGGGGGGGSSTLSGLTDVDLTNPTDGQTLVYDAASQKWVNGSGGGGGLSQYQVTFINSGSAGTRYTVNLGSCALSDGNTSVYFIQTAVTVDEQRTVTFYQPSGLAVFLPADSISGLDYSVMPVVTGNIEFYDTGFIITGNGTITMSAYPVN